MKNKKEETWPLPEIFSERDFREMAREKKYELFGQVGFKKITTCEKYSYVPILKQNNGLELQKGESCHIFICKGRPPWEDERKCVVFAFAGKMDIYSSYNGAFPMDFRQEQNAWRTSIKGHSFSLIRRCDDSTLALVLSENMCMDRVIAKTGIREKECRPVILFDEMFDRIRTLAVGYGFYEDNCLRQMFDVKKGLSAPSQIEDLNKPFVRHVEIGKEPEKIRYQSPLNMTDTKEYSVYFDNGKIYYEWD